MVLFYTTVSALHPWFSPLCPHIRSLTLGKSITFSVFFQCTQDGRVCSGIRKEKTEEKRESGLLPPASFHLKVQY